MVSPTFGSLNSENRRSSRALVAAKAHLIRERRRARGVDLDLPAANGQVVERARGDRQQAERFELGVPARCSSPAAPHCTSVPSIRIARLW